MQRLRILFDMDGIITAFPQGWLERVNEYLVYLQRPPMTVQDITSYEMHDLVPPELRANALKIYQERGFFRSLRPLELAAESLASLQRLGHHVHIVTAALTPWSLGEKAEWLAEHLPMIPYQDNFFCWRKELIKGDVLVDDNPKNIKAYREAWPEALVTGIYWPYNMNVPGLVHSWADEPKAWLEILRQIQEYAER